MTRRFGHGLVLGKFYPFHAGHQLLIRTASAQCERLTVQVLANSAETIPLETRVSWIREEHPEVHVVDGMDEAEVDFDSPAAWDAHMEVIEALLDAPVDAAFSSDAYGAELARRLGATWVQVNPGRLGMPVSGTAIRADVAGHWWALPAPVRASLVRRVVVLGAESTGTTTLSRDLAQALGCGWVPEFGRQWSLDRPGGLAAPWHSAEFDLIAREQSRREDAAARLTPVPWLICDTDVLATTVWHERYVGTRSPTVEALAAARRPSLYVLTSDNIPFVQDGMRDGEHLRSWMTQRFREVLDAQSVPWIEVGGSPQERLERVRWGLRSDVPFKRVAPHRETQPAKLPNMELSSMTPRELLQTYASILTELVDREIIRTRNAPVGDVAEFLVAAAYSGHMAPNSEKSWDVVDTDGRKIQVKARLVAAGSKARQQYSPFRSWDFDVCVFIMFDAGTYEVRQAVEVPSADVRVAASPVPHVGATAARVHTSTHYENSVDVTDRLRAAMSALDVLASPSPQD